MSIHDDPDRPQSEKDYSRRAVLHNGVWHILPEFELLRVSQPDREHIARPKYHCLCGRQFFAIKPNRHYKAIAKEDARICSVCLEKLNHGFCIDSTIYDTYKSGRKL